MTTKFLFSLWLLIAFPLAAFGAYDCADPKACRVTCNGTNDHLDIIAAISAVSTGGRVSIAAGSCQIAATVTVNKAMTLAGAGATLTTFTGTASPMVIVSHGATGLARVTGIAFTSDVNILLRLSGPITQVRVDHTKIVGSNYGVYAVGRVEGVVDHNEFVNCDQCVMSAGANSAAWNLDFDAVSGNFIAGSSHMLFIETNIFERNASFAKDNNEIHYSQDGARTVFRYNSVDYRQFPRMTWVYDAHGNGLYYDEQGGVYRGPPINEIYENTFLLNVVARVMGLRGGSNLVFNNTINIANPPVRNQVIVLWEEEAWSGSGQAFTAPGFDYVWPDEDMVTNTFIWGNTIKFGTDASIPLTASNIFGGGSGTQDCCGTYPDSNKVINYNRDVWMHAPAASGGRTYYNGRPGASGRNADGTLVFTTSSPNAYYPYTPYTYPHPLTAPAAPTGPTIIR